MKRDFTYIDDIVDGISKLIKNISRPNPSWNGNKPDPANSYAPYRIFNIGNNNPVELERFISTLEKHIGIKAEKKLLPIQPGDIQTTYADINDLKDEIGFIPRTNIEEGLKNFVDWYKLYYKINSLY